MPHSLETRTKNNRREQEQIETIQVLRMSPFVRFITYMNLCLMIDYFAWASERGCTSAGLYHDSLKIRIAYY